MNERLVGWLVPCALLTSACISTDVEPPDLPVCTAQLLSGDASNAVVELQVETPVSYNVCNAVAIAPTLLLTTISCITVPAAQPDFMTPRCQSATGAPQEDGSFAYRYLAVADVSGFTVKRDDATPFESQVRRVFVSDLSSTCMPDIAVVEMQPGLAIPALPLRIERVSHVSDEVTVSGFDFSGSGPEQHQSDATIEQLTDDIGSDGLAPRSLQLSGQSCALEGGAVLARETGALVGLVTVSDLTIDCLTPMGRPTAVRLEPYRQFLLDTARAAETSLLAEMPVGGRTGLIRACAR